MKKNLEDIPEDQKMKAAILLETMERELGVEKAFIISKSRKDNIAVMRAMCFHILIKVENFGPSNAGAVFGKDHATAKHGSKIHKESYETNFEGYKDKYERLISRYLFERESKSEVSEFFDVMNKLNEKMDELKRIMNALVGMSISKKPLNPELLEIINETFPEDDKRTIIEQNIANGIQLG